MTLHSLEFSEIGLDRSNKLLGFERYDDPRGNYAAMSG